MDKNIIKIIEKLKLQIKIIQIQLAILLLKQKLTIPNLDNPKKIIIHHGGGWLDFYGVNKYHRQKWGFKSSLGYYAGYTYFIERTGKIFQARRDNEEGAHTRGQNKMSIGICLMGNGCEKDFTPEQYKALENLVTLKRCRYNIPISEIYGHNSFAATLCPSPPLEKWISKVKVG